MPLGDPLPVVREAVREILTASPAFAELDSDRRRELAHSMVQVCHVAASLIQEEVESDQQARTAAAMETEARATAPRGVARALNAGSEFSGVSASRVASTTRAILNAVSFPRFVTELINGVFKAMLDSSAQQMNSFVELLNNVASSLEGFADTNVGAVRAREWLVETFPGSYEIEGDGEQEDAPTTPEERAELAAERGERKVRLRGGGSPPTEQALRTGLGIPEGESVPTGDPERVLVPLVRRRLAKSRQEMLATMVQMGMQRIVIDSGRITAAMRFHIDTRSAAMDDRGSSFDLHNTTKGEGSFGVGPWGAKASMENTIGYVSTSKTQTTEEMNTDLDLNSSVEINFRSDYLPLNRLAAPGQAEAIRANSRNPEAEERAAIEERKARGDRNARLDEARLKSLDNTLRPPPTTPPATPPTGANTPAQPPKQPANTQTPNAQTPNAQTPNTQTPNAQTPNTPTPNAQGGTRAPNTPPANNPTTNNPAPNAPVANRAPAPNNPPGGNNQPAQANAPPPAQAQTPPAQPH
ncbi:MAG TPA: hypothetical protein VIP11_22480 [Gemmatimonadaceae bacterium]